MQLFKRLLLSYFPDSLARDSFNPASMFISFISAKDFFTIINRKIIENYKLNMFDLSMDIFEGKLGLGMHKDMMQSKMTDTYYSYIAAANFNGYKFYNIGNTANGLVLVAAMYLYSAFNEGEDDIFIDSLYAFYLLSFLFAARIKIFPKVDEKSDFQRFIDLYFDFFYIVTVQLKHKISKKNFQEIKTKMLTQIEVFFMMFYYYQRVNNLYLNQSEVGQSTSKEFYHRLFGSQPTSAQKTFLQRSNEITENSKFGEIEEAILFDIVPADIHLKYIFLDTDTQYIVSDLIENIFDKKILDKKLTALMKHELELDFILDYVTNPDNFKKGFFKGVKQYSSHIRLQDQDSYEELDEMISEIGDDLDKLEQMQIPASIKKESRIMEQFLNFYVTYLGGLSISRADTFFLRFFKSGLIPELVKYFDVYLKSDQAIQYSGMSHFLYVKNQTYYQFVNKKIRSGKEKFFIPATPLKPEVVKATSFLMKSVDETALITLLQDSNPQIGKLYIKNKLLLDWFQAQYSSQISQLIQLSPDEFIYQYYAPIFSHFQLGDNVLSILQNAFTEQDIVRLKNSLYAFDVQLFREVMSLFPRKKFQNLYNDTVMLQHLALLRETLFGFLIYYQYLNMVQNSEKGEKSLELGLLKKVYILNILNWDESLLTSGIRMVDTLLEQFGVAFSTFVEIDDNKEFFSILRENWIDFLKKLGKKSDLAKQSSFSTEDLLRLRGVLKHITYYNKRFLIPN